MSSWASKEGVTTRRAVNACMIEKVVRIAGSKRSAASWTLDHIIMVVF
jgi:hypothetical protein